MGAFNQLRAEARCPNCDETSEQLIQFRFGDTWQFEYAIGDTLRWGGNDVGPPGLTKVLVSGAGEECPVCHSRGEDFQVVIESDVITAVEDAPEGPPSITDGELFRLAEKGPPA
jgi:hypothetical protein